MAIHFGNDKIKDIYVGSDKIKEVYYGSELVYTALDTRGYWVNRNTGVITYFGLDDPSIVDGIMSSPPWRSFCSEVKIPLGVTSLDDECFSFSGALTSITLPEGVTSLGESCFAACTSLTSITLSEDVTNLGVYCFYECTSLTSITLPESVNSIGVECFRRCSSLTLVTVLPATPPSLGTSAFFGVPFAFNIKVRSPYVDDYKTATNWQSYSNRISAI